MGHSVKIGFVSFCGRCSSVATGQWRASSADECSNCHCSVKGVSCQLQGIYRERKDLSLELKEFSRVKFWVALILASNSTLYSAGF